ncbi:peptidase inhibitor family I36 protein [Actinoplanes sp. NPDC051633]|uniref:peptidase inhibitor family I36 protein n=1 Tax=Actinoplanes sp. NPDC051633 TaxID=3155670 RepID=UPI0034186D73
MTVTHHPSRTRRTAAVLALAVALCAAFLAGSPAAQAATADAPHLITTINGAQIWHSTEHYSYKCPVDRICIWTGTDFTGYGIFYPDAAVQCHGWRFEGSVWQDHTYSIWNRTTGHITIWDRAHDGSYRYSKYGYLHNNYIWGSTPFSYIMDGWVDDLNNTCTTPTFVHHIT